MRLVVVGRTKGRGNRGCRGCGSLENSLDRAWASQSGKPGRGLLNSFGL